MTIRYCASTGSNTAPYETWAKAATAPKTITDLMGAGDISYFRNETFTIAADTTFTLAGSLTNPAICIGTASTAEPPTTIDAGFLVDGSGTVGVDITISGKAILKQMDFKNGGSSSAAIITIAGADEDVIIMEECDCTIGNTHNASGIVIGAIGSSINSYVRTVNCNFTFGNASGQGFDVQANWENIGGAIGITTTVPTTLIQVALGSVFKWRGVDISAITTTLIIAGLSKAAEFYFYNCDLGSGVTIVSPTSPGHAQAYLIDCASGDTHYEFAHYSYWGNTTISTAIYLNTADGASYNAADAKYSWKITGVNGSYAHPYMSPLITVHHEGTGAITPRLEVLRDGSTTAYNDDEVWAEFTAKVTTTSVVSTLYSDRRGMLTAAAAQGASALGASDWFGETTPWYGKLVSPSMTPAEIGDITARVCVAGANTLYVNPKILGLA